ncbi:hypothetical protein P9112_002719 [Eukaryota sp. TZLM1-RC]
MVLLSPEPRTIKSIASLQRRSFFQRLDVLPFLLLYTVILPFLLINSTRILIYISYPVLVFLHILLFLFQQWSLRCKCFVSYKPSPVTSSDSICVITLPHCGSSSISPLIINSHGTFFEHHRSMYFYNTDKKQFYPLKYPDDLPLTAYVAHKGITSSEISSPFPSNTYSFPIPSFLSLFKEHALAPFFVFQVFCVLLWCLDDYWYYSVFTLVMLVLFEASMVFNRQKSLKELTNLSSNPFEVFVYRAERWTKVLTSELLPLDLVSLSMAKRSTIPCDCVVVAGTCIVDESLLTGESVPQYKESLEVNGSSETFLEEEKEHKVSCLYSGSEMISIKSDCFNGLKSPDNGAICVVTRTGFATKQGSLLKSMLYQTEKVSINNKEAGIFLTIILAFATLASGYLFKVGYEQLKGSELEESQRNSKLFKLILNCLLTLTSVVPPELPMELSLAVSSSLNSLAKLGIFCTEPFRIPVAGKVNVCLFDKTGTITEDSHVVVGVCSCDQNAVQPELRSVSDLDLLSRVTLAGANSLSVVNSVLVGDSMEKSAMKSAGFKLKSDNSLVAVKRGTQNVQLKILKRFPFRSVLKRMSTICRYGLTNKGSSQLLYLTKGAPEAMRSMFKEVPVNYDRFSKFYELTGHRVLALGYKLTDLKVENLNSVTRTDTENDLIFAGLLVFKCPVRQGSNEIIQELVGSRHRSVILTGDSVLTGVHVAQSVKMIGQPKSLRSCLVSKKSRKLINFCKCGKNLEFSQPLVLIGSESKYFWTTVDHRFGEVRIDLEDPCLSCFELAIDGNGLEFLKSEHPLLLDKIFEFITVIGRADPTQKSFVSSFLIDKGLIVSMIGDGSNDCGALRKSNIGIGLVEGNERIQKLRRTYLRNRNENRGKDNRPKRVDKKVKKVSSTFSIKNDWNDDEISHVKPGDASLAASFSSCLRGIEGMRHVLTFGRSSLTATLQVYKILAVNSLISGYLLSFLFVKGVEFGDSQMVITGLLTALLFFVVSRSQPEKDQYLSFCRPPPRVISFYTVFSVAFQCITHFFALKFGLFLLGPEAVNKVVDVTDFDSEFQPSSISSLVFILSQAFSCATFIINYRGKPFSLPIFRNKPLIYSSIGFYFFIFSFLLLPECFLHTCLHIISFSWDVRFKLLGIIAVDFLFCFSFEWFFKTLFTERQITPPVTPIRN